MLEFRHAPLAATGLLGTLLVLTGAASVARAGQGFRPRQPTPILEYNSDLLHSSSLTDLAPSPTLKSLAYGLTAQDNQINDKHLPTLKSGPRAPVSDNHATYVEPPANFKPIIYEQPASLPDALQRQHQSQRRRFQPSVPEPSGPAASDTFLESPNHLVASMMSPISGQGSSRQQAKRQTEARAQASQQQQQPQQPQQQQRSDQGATSGEQDDDTNATTDEQPDGAEEPNSAPMKPSIDRWSDWHDMSVDPDLASSETQSSPGPSASAHSAQVDPRQGQVERLHQALPASLAAYGHKQAEVKPQNSDVGLMFSPAEDHARPFQVLPLINQLYHHHDHHHNHHHRQQQQQQQQQQQMLAAANLIKMQQSPVAPAIYELKQDHSFQALAHNYHNYYHHSGQQQQLPAARLQEQQHPYHQRPSTLQPQTFYYIPQQQQQQPPPASPQMARSSYVPFGPQPTLAMLQNPQLPLTILMQPLGLSAAASNNNEKVTNLFMAAGGGYEHQHYQTPAALDGFKRSRKLKSHSANAEVKLIANQAPLQERQPNAPLVLGAQHRELAIVGKQATPLNAPPSSPTGGGRPLTPAHVSSGAANAGSRTAARPSALANATTTNASQPKRVLKRRRIKTLLPVGLSSWFLGGIRDLDARHWKLPNEVMNKLAINDVDLQHAGASGHAYDDPSSVINISNHVQAGGSVEKADSPRSTSTRSPSNQMNPR